MKNVEITNPESEKKTLPLFRQDLELYQGPDDPDGSPSFNIFDPVKSQYYKISWGESLIIKNLKADMTVDDLCNALNANTTLKVTPAEVKRFFEDAARHNLLSLPRPSMFLIKEHENKKESLFKWLIHHYLYVRIPLFNPDNFLKKTLKYVKPFASTPAFILYAMISAFGLILLFLNMEEFTHTFTYFFNLKGFVYYALALTTVKIIHELGHAYTAVNFHVRVPNMGVCLLVLWPVLYTDVTDGWKLKNRTHRLYISLAGIIVETVLAGLCTFGWVMTNSDQLKSIFFVVSTISWGSTLFLNANPMMRFDGYYILSDLWGIDNLQPRAFALARWKMRDWLWGLKSSCPEPRLSPKYIRWMIIYSICTWIYRLILYTGIAIFVYVSFTKAVGLFLFFLEIGVFIVWPLASEIVEVYRLRKQIKARTRFIVFTIALLLIFSWMVIPVSHTERFTAITAPYFEQTLYVPYDSIVAEIYAKRDKTVTRGEKLVRLKSVELEKELKSYTAEAAMVKQQIKILGLEDANVGRIPEKSKELEGIFAKKRSIQSKLNELILTAHINGQVISWNENLRVNQHVSKDLVIGKIADKKIVSVVSFVPESILGSVQEGQSVEFLLNGGAGKYSGKIEKINPVRATRLLYPALASIYNGDLPVIEDTNRQLIMIESYFSMTVILDVKNDQLSYGKVGYLRVQGAKRSLLVTFFKDLIGLFWRESGF
jgi:putative peptide zinc metalloprotease protein